MFCPQCGQAVSSDSRFCGKCGQQVAAGGSGSRREGSAGAGVGNLGMAAVAAPGIGSGAAGASAAGFGAGAASAGVGAGASSAGAGSAGVGASGPDVGSAGAGMGASGLGATAAGPQALPGLVDRIKNILLAPKTEWPVIAAEPTSISELYAGYVAPMAAFASLMSFIRMSVIGVSIPFGGTIRTPMVSGLMSAVVTFILGLIGLFLVGFIINMLAPTFSGARDLRQALKTAAYALTPAWLGTALTFLPMGALLQLLAGVYGIYVLYLGLPVVMRAKQQNAGGYTATVVGCTFLVGILFGVVGAALGGAAHLGAFGGGSAAMYDSQSPESKAAAAERGGAVLGNMVGGMLGTDEKGKEGLSNAFANLAKAGEQMEREQAAVDSGSSGSAAGTAGGSPSAVAGGTNAAGANAAAGVGASSGTNVAGGTNAIAGAAGGASAGATAAGAGASGGTNGAGTSGSAGAASGGTAGAGDTQAATATNALAATGGLLSALGGALGGSHRVDPVDFKTLETMLPASLPDMQRTNAEGSSQQAIGVKSTSATADYEGSAQGAANSGSANPRVEIKIADLSGVSGLMDAANSLAAKSETESDSGFEKDTVVNGREVHEKYDRRSGEGELNAIIAKRFNVEITGRGIQMAQLEKTLGTIDLGRLEAMKDAGAQAR